MLSSSHVMAFVATTQPEKAKHFYSNTLGVRLEQDTPFALVLQAPNALVRIQKVQAFTPHPFTALGWEVKDIAETANQLASKGVQFERFEGMRQDETGIWISPAGAKVCWFKDPDGNLVSLTESP